MTFFLGVIVGGIGCLITVVVIGGLLAAGDSGKRRQALRETRAAEDRIKRYSQRAQMLLLAEMERQRRSGSSPPSGPPS
jgi:hypothetical protein